MFQITLAAARVNSGFKQTEAAELLGVTAKTLSGYETGRNVIPGRILQRAAKIYNIPSDSIKLPITRDGIYDDLDISHVV